jgi:hypothetical protein
VGHLFSHLAAFSRALAYPDTQPNTLMIACIPLVNRKGTHLSHTQSRARELAEAAFKKVSHPRAMTDVDVQAQIIQERTARLRTLRLARESADKQLREGR